MRVYNVGIVFFLIGSIMTIRFLWLEQESRIKLALLRTQTPKSSEPCEDCKEHIDDIVKQYSQTWKKNEEKYQQLRQQLHTQCNGSDEAIISQANSPLGSKISGRHIVKGAILQLFPKVSPLSNNSYETCAVIGNGGILYSSYCGKMIDSSDFVIRCNLPPLYDGFDEHVGRKSHIVSANPTIFENVYGTKPEHQRLLLEKLYPFRDAMILIPAFSYQTSLILRAVNTLKHFKSPSQPVFLNPKYMDRLKVLWRAKGVIAPRLSSGLMMVSMALEVCKNVHVYGFWPFSNHPFNQQHLRHHYYDDVLPKPFHAMPTEFEHLLQLHMQGVIQLHLGKCGT